MASGSSPPAASRRRHCLLRFGPGSHLAETQPTHGNWHLARGDAANADCRHCRRPGRMHDHKRSSSRNKHLRPLQEIATLGPQPSEEWGTLSGIGMGCGGCGPAPSSATSGVNAAGKTVAFCWELAASVLIRACCTEPPMAFRRSSYLQCCVGDQNAHEVMPMDPAVVVISAEIVAAIVGVRAEYYGCRLRWLGSLTVGLSLIGLILASPGQSDGADLGEPGHVRYHDRHPCPLRPSVPCAGVLGRSARCLSQVALPSPGAAELPSIHPRLVQSVEVTPGSCTRRRRASTPRRLHSALAGRTAGSPARQCEDAGHHS